MSFLSKKFDSSKLKTNLRVSINRLKLLEKKKTEISLKSRKEIAEYIEQNKEDRARIKVEQIIREDYLVEAMEIIEMFCDLLLARMGLIQTSKEVDPGLEESIATLIWVSPRLQCDVPEFKAIMSQLQVKYGKEFTDACLSNSMNNVSEKIMQKLSCQSPPKPLVEQYMIEIARSYNIPFEPDPSLLEVPDVDDIIAICPPDMNFFQDTDIGGNSGGGASGQQLPFGGNYPPSGQFGYVPGHASSSIHSGSRGSSVTGSHNDLPNMNEQPPPPHVTHYDPSECTTKSDLSKLQPGAFNESVGSDTFQYDRSTFPPSYNQSVNPHGQMSGQAGLPFMLPPQIPSRPPEGPLPPIGGSIPPNSGSESAGTMEDLDDLVKRFEDLKKKSG